MFAWVLKIFDRTNVVHPTKEYDGCMVSPRGRPIEKKEITVVWSSTNPNGRTTINDYIVIKRISDLVVVSEDKTNL